MFSRIIFAFLIATVGACTSGGSKSGSGEMKSSSGEITTKEIKYRAGGKDMVGYLATPANMKPDTPGILVVHEWWGQTDYPRMRARMLAELGYAAMAVDMYGERKIAKHPKKAGEFSGMIMKDAGNVAVPFRAAMAELRKVPNVARNKIAAVGYCFGGSVVLEMARQGVDLAGVVSFHGGLMTPTKAKPGKVDTKVLVMNGADDGFVKKDDITAFKNEMKKAKVNYRFINYPNAVHGFTNPGATDKGKEFKIPLAYNPAVDRSSWAEMQAFFGTIF